VGWSLVDPQSSIFDPRSFSNPLSFIFDPPTPRRSARVVEVIALARPMRDFRETADCSSHAAFHFAPTEKFHALDSSALTEPDDSHCWNEHGAGRRMFTNKADSLSARGLAFAVPLT
jgi:hypothetical protein